MAMYLLDNAWKQAQQRLSRLEAVFDPGTFSVLNGIGVEPGWYCLEVGAGAGSVACWLASRVGLTGSVVATDIDPRHVSPLAVEFPNLEVRRHDIVADPLPKAVFELVHARLVLEHLPQRDHALRRMVDAVAPGGWLIVEAIDFGSEAPDPGLGVADSARFERWHAAQTRFLADRGFDHTYARGLVRRLRGLGLEEIRTEGRAATWWGGSAGADVWRLTMAQWRDPLIAGGYLDGDEADAIEALFADKAFAATSPLIVAAWGRRPLSPTNTGSNGAGSARSIQIGG
jgi:SAM-dependent methyltransferase